MSDTQSHLPIEDIQGDLVFLKNGSVVQIIETSAVNFGLLFETEQVAIIDSFAGLLNSLSFPIQIIIRSQRLDVSSYLGVIDKAIALQQNPLIKNMTLRYRHFVGKLISENEVLDKKFYITVTASHLEMGVLHISLEERTKRALTLLKPRIDHLNKQLARIGLKSQILTTSELVKSFYEIYNSEGLSVPPPAPVSQSSIVNRQSSDSPAATITHLPPQLPPQAQPIPPQPVAYAPAPSYSPPPPQSNSHSPFVVEELHEEAPH